MIFEGIGTARGAAPWHGKVVVVGQLGIMSRIFLKGSPYQKMLREKKKEPITSLSSPLRRCKTGAADPEHEGWVRAYVHRWHRPAAVLTRGVP